jgi:hypothetical protein
MNKPILITKSGLKSRGWTEKSIMQFLCQPDLCKPNPHYKSGSPMQLYDEKRVLRAESSNKFQNWFKSKKTMSEETKQKILTTKKKKTLEIIANVEDIIPILSKEKLEENSKNNYFEWNDRNLENADRNTLDRICVNYLRHICSEYEDKIDELYNMCGKNEALQLLRRSIYESIIRKYPYLESECHKQMIYRGIQSQQYETSK